MLNRYFKMVKLIFKNDRQKKVKAYREIKQIEINALIKLIHIDIGHSSVHWQFVPHNLFVAVKAFTNGVDDPIPAPKKLDSSAFGTQSNLSWSNPKSFG